MLGIIMQKRNHSPFRYPGGKFYARKIILKNMPAHEKYCEVFAGGASIFFAKEKVKVNVLNDLNTELMNCYAQIRDHVDELIQLLNGAKATKELHAFYKNDYHPENNLEKAFRWFYLNRTSYSGIMKPENCYWGYGDKYSMRPENWPTHLRTVSERLQGVTFSNLDFEALLEQLDDGFFLFIDPPYYNAKQDGFYETFFRKEDHARLANVLKNHQHRFQFLLTYDNSPEIRGLYSWCHAITDQAWNYTMSRTDDQKNGKQLKDGHTGARYKGREIFITNYHQSGIQGLSEFKFAQHDDMLLRFSFM